MKSSRPALFLAAIVAALAIPAGAQAQITLGQLAPGVSPPTTCVGSSDLVPVFVTAGRIYEAPTNGVITSWSTNAAAGVGQELTFKVFRANQGNFFVVGHDGPRLLAPSTINTFRTSIAVREGDVLAVSATNGATVNSACAFAAPEDLLGEGEGAKGDGETVQLAQTLTGLRLNLGATLLEPPKVTAIGTSKGSVTGGTPVTIAGVNFAEVQSVTFNDVPAKSFTVNSEGQITAISPAVNALTDAPVKVNTVAGTSTALQSFRYEGCAVPQLKRKKLSEAKRRLVAGGCQPGKVKKVRGPRSKAGKVLKQSVKPGGPLLRPGTKVALAVGR